MEMFSGDLRKHFVRRGFVQGYVDNKSPRLVAGMF